MTSASGPAVGELAGPTGDDNGDGTGEIPGPFADPRRHQRFARHHQPVRGRHLSASDRGLQRQHDGARVERRPVDVEGAESACQQRSRFQGLAEVVDESLWVVDRVGDTVFANGTMARLLDVDVIRLYSVRIDDLIDAQARRSLEFTVLP